MLEKHWWWFVFIPFFRLKFLYFSPRCETSFQPFLSSWRYSVRKSCIFLSWTRPIASLPPSFNSMTSLSFTYQQYQTSLRHQRCLPSPSFLVFFIFSFHLLSSPPPYHHCCKAFIHMPVIPDCIPHLHLCLLPFSHHCFSAPVPLTLHSYSRERMRKWRCQSVLSTWTMHYFL